MSATISEFASGWKKSIQLLQLAPDKKKAEIHWGDETGLRSDDVKGRSYAR